MKKVLFIGLGSIGQRHYRNLKKIKKNFKFYALRKIKKSPELDRYNNINSEKFNYNQKYITELKNEETNNKFDIIFICNPSSLHVKYSLKFAKKGSALFIEKPLSHNLHGVNKLKHLIKKNKIICAVGFQLRYEYLLIKIKEIILSKKLGKIKKAYISNKHYLPYHHKYEDYKTGYAAKKKLGGGAILCFIHELDYANFLFGKISNIKCKCGKKSNLQIDVEDYAKIKCNYILGDYKFPVYIDLDFIKRKEERKCKIIFDNGLVYWDLKLNILKIYKNKKLIDIIKNYNDRDKLFTKQLKEFLKCIKNQQVPKSNIDNGISSLKMALYAKRSNKLKKTIQIKL